MSAATGAGWASCSGKRALGEGDDDDAGAVAEGAAGDGCGDALGVSVDGADVFVAAVAAAATEGIVVGQVGLTASAPSCRDPEVVGGYSL